MPIGGMDFRGQPLLIPLGDETCDWQGAPHLAPASYLALSDSLAAGMLGHLLTASQGGSLGFPLGLC